MTATAPILELKGITKCFGKLAVVNDLSLRLSAGEVMCLLGPSGCGKTTTLRIAAGVEEQTSGEVLLNGEVISDAREHMPPELRGIGLMFQDFALFPHLNVAQNVGFGIKREKDRDTRVAELLAAVELSDFGSHYPHQLSGGEQQRVALARALAPRPKIMLMDEPFSGLDNRLRDGVRDTTMALLKAEGTAVLLVTHEPEEAMRMADHIVLMRDGKIVQSGAPYNIYNAPKDAAAAAFFSDVNLISGTVQGALTKTPFGQFLTPGFEEGDQVEILIRPQHIKIDFDRNGRGPNPTVEDGTPARGVVTKARYMGQHSEVLFALDFGGHVLKAIVPGVFLPKDGTVLWLSARRDRCFVFRVDHPPAQS